MSLQSAAHYSEIAGKHGIHALPPIMSEPYLPLLPAAAEIAIRPSENERTIQLKQNYAEIVESVGPYLIACTVANVPTQGGRTGDEMSWARDIARRSKHFEGMIETFLKPKWLSTGSLKGIQTQAAAPHEITPSILNQSLGGVTADERRSAEVNSVFLVTSAYILPKRLSKLGYTAFVTCLRISSGSEIVCRGRQFTPGELARTEEKWKPTAVVSEL